MMKRFFTVMLGSLAAIWISAGLLVVLGFLCVTALFTMTFKEPDAPRVKDNSILYLDLGTTLAELNPRANFQAVLYGVEENYTLLQPTIDAIAYAENDSRIKGIYINANPIAGGVASLKSLNDALTHFKENSGKWIIAYGDQITQGSYYLSSVADRLYINPQGMLDIHGLSSSILFYKGLFEKLGVKVQVLKVGTFKSAVEPYILDSISPANRLQMMAYMGSIWDNLLSTMAESRGLTCEALNLMADSMLLTESVDNIIKKGLVDESLYRHQVEDELREKIGVSKDDALPLVAVSDYYASVKEKLTNKSDNKIAVLYAVGEITEDGSEGITSSSLVPQILDLAENDDIKGMVLRVNSPGGSAFASEQIWEALEQFKASGKKLYVSMGDLAASGGYYISCGADKIYCSPVTLTGSIGIFGLVPNVKGLLKDHLGINESTVNTNSNGNFPSITEPMTPFQFASMQKMIERGYETFVGRCAEGRHMSVDSIKAIAEGRVWAGETALELGLVDTLGSLDDAIVDLAADMDLNNYQVVVYPRQKMSFWDVVNSLNYSVSSTVLRHVLGEEAYELYRKAKRVEGLDAVQCRMEEVELTL